MANVTMANPNLSLLSKSSDHANPDGVPDREDDHYGDYREGQTSRPTVYPSAQNKLQRQRDQQAARHQQEVWK